MMIFFIHINFRLNIQVDEGWARIRITNKGLISGPANRVRIKFKGEITVFRTENRGSIPFGH